MRAKPEILTVLVVFGLLAGAGRGAVLAAEETPAAPQTPKAPDKAAAKVVAATVNGEPIYEEQVNAEFERRWGASKKRGLQTADPNVLKQLRHNALDTLIDNELVLQASRKLQIDDADQRVAAKLKDLEAKHGAGAKFEGYLKRRSLTLEEFKKTLRTRVYADEYLKRQGVAEPDIPEAQIREMYEKNPKGFTKEETVHVSHILIAADAHAGTEAQDQARQKAEKLRGEIVQGKDFGELAKAHSKCNSAAGGGDLGFVKRNFMPKEFDAVAFALEKGAVSEPVKTKFGYHLVKVHEKSPAGVVPYPEIRDFIRKYLQQEESRKRLAAHIKELRSQAKLEVLLK